MASRLHTLIARATCLERWGLDEAPCMRSEASWAALPAYPSTAAAPSRSARHASQSLDASSMYSSSQAAPPGRWSDATRRARPACAARSSASAARSVGSDRNDDEGGEDAASARSRSSSPRASVA
uniref:Uncharacterized protein n=1 Tax=Zea mays TaxID=4577 RepID=C4J700_MAIZE|nr:unknown [Zea mays]|eukprot:NP_001183490.1 uncharacterized protein LOC100501923 [Zea mays]